MSGYFHLRGCWLTTYPDKLCKALGILLIKDAMKDKPTIGSLLVIALLLLGSLAAGNQRWGGTGCRRVSP